MTYKKHVELCLTMWSLLAPKQASRTTQETLVSSLHHSIGLHQQHQSFSVILCATIGLK
jgi:hypothetical protein